MLESEFEFQCASVCTQEAQHVHRQVKDDDGGTMNVRIEMC